MRRISISILIFVLFVLSACTSGNQQFALTGSDGLIMTLGDIPKIVYQDQGFTIPVTLENAGASKLTDGILALSIPDPNIVHLTSTQTISNINLNGRSQLSSQGEKITQYFEVGSITLPENKEKTEVFEAIACYKYETDSSPIVCINSQATTGAAISSGTCDPSKVTMVATQGAPIAVTNIVPTFYPSRSQVDFTISVKDVSGSGISVTTDSYSKSCLGTQEVSASEQNQATIQVFMSGSQLSCRTAGTTQETNIVKLSNDGPSIICTANINTQDQPFTTPLTIKLTYGYVTRKAFSVDFKSTTVQ